MKKWFLAIVVATLGTSALAGFVDERTTAEKPVPAPVIQPAEAAQRASGPPAAAVFAVLDTDRSIRDALARWAASAGWMHLPEHWAVAEDYSVGGIAGSEVFGSDFRQAVRTLISSTELTTRPAQPCFYTNHVVRVIPRAGICDPSAR